MTLDETLVRLSTLLAEVDRLGVAYSGGVDPSVLLGLATRVLGPANVVGVVGVSASLAGAERESAHDVAAGLGVRVVEVATYEGDFPAYRANGPDRCFHCKDELFTRISDEVVDRLRLDAVAYGENADDALRPDRPGSRAATAHAVLRPLADLGSASRTCGHWPATSACPTPTSRPRLPGVAHPPLHRGRLREAGPGRGGRARRAGARVRRLPGAAPRRGRAGRAARGRPGPRGGPRDAGATVDAVRGAGFRFVTVDLAGIQSGAFTLPLVAVSHG